MSKDRLFTYRVQGQERRVIIISTVRSNPEYVQMDNQYKLGFLRNPKRFNVAITRAKALLIIVGNPHILSQDDDWMSLIKFALDEGGYTGCQFTQEDEVRTADNDISILSWMVWVFFIFAGD